MDGSPPLPPRLPLPRPIPAVPSALLATLIFVGTEVMVFAGMISAFTITRANQPPGMWPPPAQPRLPVESTLLNTVALLASGLLLFLSYRAWKAGRPSARSLYLGAWLMGAVFVGLQGREWSVLLGDGLTLRSSMLGAFFYLIVGCHALHAIGALGVLAWGAVRLWRGTMPQGLFFGSQAFWYFVVLMWPIVYARVYF